MIYLPIKILLSFFLLFDYFIYLPVVVSPPERIAFIGDSVTYGAWDYKEDGSLCGYACRVGEQLEVDYKKFPLYTFPATFENWQQIVDYQPTTIVIELGLHILPGGQDTTTQSDDEIRAAVSEVMDRALLITPNVLYILPPLWSQLERTQHISAIISEEAAERGIKTVDVGPALIACGDACKSYDIHPNSAGHQIIANAVIDALK